MEAFARNELSATDYEIYTTHVCLTCIKNEVSPMTRRRLSQQPSLARIQGGEHERAIVPEGTIAPEGGSGYGTPLKTWDEVKSLRS